MKHRVLVIDDDEGLRTLLKLTLERDGYEVETAADGTEGLRKAFALHPDVVVLDVMMAEMDGWATCQRLRQVTQTPIIMLTAVSDVSSVVKALSIGADDYVTKPCRLDELRARLRSVLRREQEARRADPGMILDDGNLRVNLAEETITLRGERVNLTPTESRLLMCLASRHGEVVSHQELLSTVWGPEYAEEVKYLGVYIRYLRKKIEDDPSSPTYIVTKHKFGYCFTMRNEQAPET